MIRNLKDIIKELFSIAELTEQLTIKLISLIGWIAILILALKGLFV